MALAAPNLDQLKAEDTIKEAPRGAEVRNDNIRQAGTARKELAEMSGGLREEIAGIAKTAGSVTGTIVGGTVAIIPGIAGIVSRDWRRSRGYENPTKSTINFFKTITEGTFEGVARIGTAPIAVGAHAIGAVTDATTSAGRTGADIAKRGAGAAGRGAVSAGGAAKNLTTSAAGATIRGGIAVKDAVVAVPGKVVDTAKTGLSAAATVAKAPVTVPLRALGAGRDLASKLAGILPSNTNAVPVGKPVASPAAA